jgi:hypothetical protein
MDSYVVACLNANVPGESSSQLWRDLAKFAFALSDEEAHPATPQLVNRVLERAAAQVEGLSSEQEWQSAARYFQAENFHAFEVPACEYARRRKATPKPASDVPK